MLPRALKEIGDGLERRRAQLLGEVQRLSQRQADWRPGAGEWSVGEVVHHLVVAEGIAGKIVSVTVKRTADAGSLLPYPSDIPAFSWQPPSADDRWLVLAPDPAAPTYGLPIDGLREDMTKQGTLTERVLQRMADLDPRAITAVHPLIGAMNAAQWYMFCEYHMSVHLRQLRDLEADPRFPRYE